MALDRKPVLNGLLLAGVAGLAAACGGGAEQFKMGLLAVQAVPPAPPPPPSFAPPPRRAFDSPPPPPAFSPPPPPPARTQSASGDVQLRGQRIEIRRKIQFQTWKSDLRRTSYALLDEIADVLKENTQVRRVEIQGHTAITRRNRERLGPLSQRRADAVRDYLIERGIQPNRLVARGYGYKRPIADNGTAEGRAANRRVEFVILEQGAPAGGGRLSAPPPPPPPPAADIGDDDFGDDEDFDDEEDFSDEDDFQEFE